VHIFHANVVAVGDLKVRQAGKSSGARYRLPELIPAGENVVAFGNLMIKSSAELILSNDGFGCVYRIKWRA